VTNGTRGNFFAVDKNQWAGVCELGMNPALLYLVMARGTCRNNTISHWSANALEKNTRIARSRAKAARERLLKSPFVGTRRTGKHPIFELSRSDDFDQTRDFIWLPNEIVTGIDSEVPAIERIRQTGDVLCLRLFIELFYQQNLVDDCGISRHCFFLQFERKKFAESGPFDIWGFSRSALVYIPRNDAVLVHDEDTSEAFFDRLNQLISLGLIFVTPYLCEGPEPDDEIIHPFASVFDCDDLTIDAEEAVLRLLPEQYENELLNYELVAPVPRHISNVTVVGIGQTRHRPKTSLTAAGMAEHICQVQQYKLGYESMGVETDMQYQGYFKVNSR
jgi:hypothetical protein